MSKNRTIKYRIWSKLVNKWVTDLFVENLCNPDSNNINDIFNNENLVFQQFTGLKDKNGKEIFEGDILKADFNTDECYSLQEVIFDVHEGCWDLKILNPDKLNFSCNQNLTLTKDEINLYSLEVFGNIYENTELLS